ncbi:MAG: hypothetical protein OXT67_13035 [Zetaproteobacteria bacterium]|nr:hypothetical protein [Zetaproteobacteria bacterium]
MPTQITFHRSVLKSCLLFGCGLLAPLCFAQNTLTIDKTIQHKLVGNDTEVPVYTVYYNGQQLDHTDPEFKFDGDTIENIVVKSTAGEHTLTEIPEPEFDRLSAQLLQGISAVMELSPRIIPECFTYLSYLKNVANTYSDCPGSPLPLLAHVGFVHEPVTLADLAPGDGIRIVQHASGHFHYAMYLGEELFISKFGTNRGISVTSLESMQTFFGFGDSSNFEMTRIKVRRPCMPTPYTCTIREISRESYLSRWKNQYPAARKYWDLLSQKFTCSPEFKQFMETHLES